MKYLVLMFLVFMMQNMASQNVLDTPPVIPTLSDFSPQVGDYYDDYIIIPIYTEAWYTKALLEAYNETNKRVLAINAVNIADLLAVSKLPNVNQTIHIINYTKLCDGFLNPLSHEKTKCIKKRDYLIEAARIANRVVNKKTSYKLNNGVIDQIGEKYLSIINTIQYELELMEIENDKRSVFRLIFD
ncbi:MAG: hypothetical protein AAFZ89_07175 [Bacteroidota bacterium]